MSRRKGRILAFQGLYSWDVGGINEVDVLKFDWVKNVQDEESKAFAYLLIGGTIENIEEIDTLIKENLSEKWDFSRLNKISIAILRMSIYSILYQKETHPAIIIDEAISIAKEFGADDSYKFINAVLDKISKSKKKDKEG